MAAERPNPQSDRGAVKISCAFHYDSAHWLPHVRRTHKCGRMHGHTYHLTVVIDGTVDDDGWVMDFAAVKEQVRPWLSRLDHRLLNDEIDNPTAERQLEWWWERLSKSLPGLCELRLQEGLNNSATYRGDD